MDITYLRKGNNEREVQSIAKMALYVSEALTTQKKVILTFLNKSWSTSADCYSKSCQRIR